MRIGFRRFTGADLPRFHRWLQDPEVGRWWPPAERTWEGVVEHYGEKNTEEQYVVLLDGAAAGWIQTYPLDVDAPYQAACTSVGVAPDAGGLDYLLGDPALRGRGFGPLVIDAFVVEVVFGAHAWPQVCAGPDPANRRSWRALEKAGFRFAGLIDTDEGPEHLMVRDRSPSLASPTPP